jgi:microcystin-dependent protein
MNNQETNNNEIDLEALLTKVQSLETMLLLTRTELKGTQAELESSQEYINRTLVGSVSAFAISDVPEGWLICDGKAVSRTVYPRLFGAMGTIYGEGDGSTTFNLPDMRGLFVRGHDPEGKNDLKREFGSYQDDEIQSHSHTDSGHSHSGSTNNEGNHSHRGNTENAGLHSHLGTTLSDGEHNHTCKKLEDYYLMISEIKKTVNAIQLAMKKVQEGRDWTYFAESQRSGGQHSHGLKINDSGCHDHPFNTNDAGTHVHTISTDTKYISLSNPTNARHGSETRVKNIALIYCIKY